jgi:glycosyltransferase involved in cell wall biosynthesis
MYNEERVAERSIETILGYTRALPGRVKFLVVDDGSRDKTGTILQRFTAEYLPDAFAAISHTVNLGYGAALKTGIRHAVEGRYDYVLFMDSDLTNHPRYLSDFFEKMSEGWDYIKATRYAKGGRVEGVPWLHRCISLVGNKVAGYLYGLPITDITNGFRAVKVDVLKRMNLSENGFAIIVEELTQAKSLTHSFYEIPYTLTSREKGQGTTHFSYSPKTWMRYLKHAVRSRLRHYEPKENNEK